MFDPAATGPADGDDPGDLTDLGSVLQTTLNFFAGDDHPPAVGAPGAIFRVETNQERDPGCDPVRQGSRGGEPLWAGTSLSGMACKYGG